MNIDETSILNKIGIFFFLNTDIVIFFFLKSLNISFSKKKRNVYSIKEFFFFFLFKFNYMNVHQNLKHSCNTK